MSGRNEAEQSKPDLGFKVIVGMIVCIVIWLLLTPFVPSVARSTLNRFHLKSSSFAWFAIQQPIPAMYNFANEVIVHPSPDEMIGGILDEGESRYINHFPLRKVTFANGRYNMQHRGWRQSLTLWSHYRGQSVETRLRLEPLGDGAYEMVREESK